MTNITEMFK